MACSEEPSDTPSVEISTNTSNEFDLDSVAHHIGEETTDALQSGFSLTSGDDSIKENSATYSQILVVRCMKYGPTKQITERCFNTAIDVSCEKPSNLVNNEKLLSKVNETSEYNTRLGFYLGKQGYSYTRGNGLFFKGTFARSHLSINSINAQKPCSTQNITEANKVHFSPTIDKGMISAYISGKQVGSAELNGQESSIIKVSGPIGTVITWTNSINSETKTTVLDGKGDYDNQGHYIGFKVDQEIVEEINKISFKSLVGSAYVSAYMSGKLLGSTVLRGQDASNMTISGPKGSVVYWRNNLTTEVFKTVLDGKGDYDGRGDYVTFSYSNEIIEEVNKVHFTPISDKGTIRAYVKRKLFAEAELNGQDASIVKVSGPKGSYVIWRNSLTGQSRTTVLDGKGEYDGRGHYISFSTKIIEETNKVSVYPMSKKGTVTAHVSGQTPVIAELDGKNASIVTVKGPEGSIVYWRHSSDSKQIIRTVLDGKGDYDDRGHYISFK